MTDLDELERLAREARQQFPWTVRKSPGADHWWVCSVHEGEKLGLVAEVLVFKSDADYIAAANPATILALVERVREAETGREYWAGVARHLQERADRAEAELKALRERVAKIDGLRRYDLDRGSGYGCGCTMERAHDGEFVMFDELEELGLAALEPVKP